MAEQGSCSKKRREGCNQEPGNPEAQSPNYSQSRAKIHISLALSRKVLRLPRRDLALTPEKGNERQKLRSFNKLWCNVLDV